MKGLTKTAIPYLDLHWPIATGCLPDKPCWAKCWARGMAHRFHRDFTPTFHADLLDAPLRSRAPAGTVVGVAFTGDIAALEDEKLPASIWLAFGIAAVRCDLAFVFLTKRPDALTRAVQAASLTGCMSLAGEVVRRPLFAKVSWPLENAYLGFSAWDQDSFDAGWAAMAPLAAAGWRVWCSLEPMIGPVDPPAADALGLWRCSCCGDAMPDGGGMGAWRWNGAAWEHKCPEALPQAGHFEARKFGGLSGIILGAESGPGARPLDLAWVRTVRDQCAAAGVPFAFKQATPPHGVGFPENKRWKGLVPYLDNQKYAETPWGAR